MRSIYGPGRLLLASKKPKIQNLIKQIDSMSLDDIRALPEKPDTIRGLLEIKELGKNKKTNAELIADKMQSLHVSQQTEKQFDIFQFKGASFWLKQKTTELFIETTWYWLQLTDKEIYISSNQIKVSPEKLECLKLNSQIIQQGTISNLRDLEKDRISKLL